MVSTLPVATVTGVVLARFVQCKLNTTCEGTRKAAVLNGSPKSDRIYGLQDGDYLLGLGQGDRLFGGRGKDILEGGDGDQANDTLNGGAGQDLYSFRDNWGQDVTVDESIIDNDPFTVNDVLFFNAAGALRSDSGEDEVSDGINSVNWSGNVVDSSRVRSIYSDTVTGNGAANYIENYEDITLPAGNDVISGAGGDDTIDVQDGFAGTTGDTVDCGEDISAFDLDNDEVHYDIGDVLVTPSHCESKHPG